MKRSHSPDNKNFISKRNKYRRVYITVLDLCILFEKLKITELI